jgi:xanthine dehydrogenase accessory factor
MSQPADQWLFPDARVAIRGGGDLGSGIACRLHRCGFPLLITELRHPLLVRRTVAFGSAAIDGQIVVEGITARHVNGIAEAVETQQSGVIPVLIDPEGDLLQSYNPAVLIDARMLKSDPGPQPGNALLVIGLGPGFRAPDNCHAAIETNRGHYLGRVIWEGHPEPNTGIPGQVLDLTAERVLRAPEPGRVMALSAIGDGVQAGQPVAQVGERIISAPFDGVLRGLVHDGLEVPAGTKIGDVDPRGSREHCFTISEKALAIGGGVLEAIFSHRPLQPYLRSRL